MLAIVRVGVGSQRGFVCREARLVELSDVEHGLVLDRSVCGFANEIRSALKAASYDITDAEISIILWCIGLIRKHVTVELSKHW